MRIRYFAILLLSVLAGFPLLATVIFVMFHSTEGIQPGSYYYHHLLSENIKKIPILEPCDPPVYGFEGADGPPVNFNTVEYKSRLKKEVLYGEIKSALATLGCTSSMSDLKDRPYYPYYDCDNKENIHAIVSLDQEGTCSVVYVMLSVKIKGYW